MERSVQRVLGWVGSMRSARRSPGRTRDVLLAAQGAMMAGHLARVLETVRDLPGTRFSMALPSRRERVPGEYDRARSLLRLEEGSEARAPRRPGLW